MTWDAGYSQDKVRRRIEWPADAMQSDYDEIPDGSVVTLDYGDGLWVYTFAVTDLERGTGRGACVCARAAGTDCRVGAHGDSRETVTPVSTSTPTPTAGLSSPTMARVEEIRAAAPDVAYDFEMDSGGWELLYDDDYATYLRDGAYHVALDATDVVVWGMAKMSPVISMRRWMLPIWLGLRRRKRASRFAARSRTAAISSSSIPAQPTLCRR